MFQSRLTLFLLLLLIISCKDENKVEFTEANKVKSNDSIIPQISADNSSEKYRVQRKTTNSKIKKVKTEEIIDTGYYPLFNKASQTFTIDQKNDTTLFCREGTIIKISRSSFVFEDDDYNEPVEVMINVREYYKTDDIIFANLSTRSGDSILETGGMIFIEAVSEKRKCKLKEDSSFEVSFPYENREENMQLFTGQLKNGTIDWISVQPVIRNFVASMEEAQYPGGIASMQQFLNDKIEYPDSLAVKGNLRLTVNFLLDSKGKVREAAIDDSPYKAFNEVVLKTFLNMPNWKAAKENGRLVRTFLKQQVVFYSSLVFESTEDSMYKFRFEEAASDSTINEIQTDEISRYIFSCTKLGWINCDRFYNERKPRTDLYVKTAAYPGADVKIIFHSFKSILQGEKTSLGYVFKGVPFDERITVLAIAKQKGKNFISLSESSTGLLIEGLSFEQVTMDVLKQKVAQLNDLRK